MNIPFKHFRRKSKRILSIMLAFAILTENPLSAYASTKATPSNIPESSASIESTDTNIDTDFGVEDFETNPDQDPDHGPGIDSTTPTYPYYRPVVDDLMTGVRKRLLSWASVNGLELGELY